MKNHKKLIKEWKLISTIILCVSIVTTGIACYAFAIEEMRFIGLMGHFLFHILAVVFSWAIFQIDNDLGHIYDSPEDYG